MDFFENRLAKAVFWALCVVLYYLLRHRYRFHQNPPDRRLLILQNEPALQIYETVNRRTRYPQFASY